MKKNKLLVAALLILISTTLTACTIQDLPLIGKLFGGGNTTPTTGPVTLNVWGLWENPDVMAKLISKYKETHPDISINYDDRSILKPDDYKDRIFSSANQQTIDADVIFVHNSWVSKIKDSLIAMPDSLMNAQTFLDNYYPVATTSAVYNGKIYAIPMYYDGLALIYNKKHFEAVGQSSPPTSWEEFRQLALTLKAKNTSGVSAAIGTAGNIDFATDIVSMLWLQAGVAIPADLNTKAAQDALTFYTNFSKVDGVWNDTMPEAATAFSREQISMMFAPSWVVNDILTARPDLDIGIAPVPQALPNDPAAWASFWMLAVPNTSKNSAAAWDFINFLAQEEQVLSMFNENTSIRKIATPFALTSLAPQLSTNPYLKAYVDTAPFAKGSSFAGRAGNKAQVDLLKTAINAVLGGVTAENALVTMTK